MIGFDSCFRRSNMAQTWLKVENKAMGYIANQVHHNNCMYQLESRSHSRQVTHISPEGS